MFMCVSLRGYLVIDDNDEQSIIKCVCKPYEHTHSRYGYWIQIAMCFNFALWFGNQFDYNLLLSRISKFCDKEINDYEILYELSVYEQTVLWYAAFDDIHT